MKTLTITVVAAVAFAAAAFALPADLVVISDREVRPDEAGGLYYLGQGGGGYLYNCSNAAVGRVAPYRILGRDAQTKDYYIVWAPAWAGLTPQAFAQLGTAVRLSDTEILVGLEPGFGPGDLRRVERRIELIKLAPVTPVDWVADAEAPPTKKSRAIEAAVNSITEQEYAGYIKRLQDFKTRCVGTAGSRYARDYIRGFFESQGLKGSLFPFKWISFKDVWYPETAGRIFILTNCATFERTRDGGRTWDIVCADHINDVKATFWLSDNVGFALGVDPKNYLVKTTDGGDSWKVVSSVGLALGVRAMYFVDADTGWLGGRTDRGFISKTADGGKTWREQSIPADFFSAETIHFFDARHGWAASGGDVIYTDDGGDAWRKCNSPATTLTDLAAMGPREAWVATGTERLLHTVDGLNWTWFDPGFGSYFSRVEFPDATHGFAVGGTIIATDDGGATWRALINAPPIGYGLAAFADRSHGVVGDWTAENLYKTDDGGETFVSIIDAIDLNEYNVIGERPGAEDPDEIVIIGGHFDSHSFDQFPSLCPGADDNASGTACAMAAARALRDVPFDRTVRYVGFGAEEWGLVGSKAYAEYCAAHGEKIVAVLNADMVCYDEDGGARDDFSVGRGGYEWLFDYLTAIGNLYGGRLIYDDFGGVSDDGSFRDVGYAAVGVIEGEKGKGGIMEYPWYHTTEDTLDKLSPELGVRFVRDYAAMFAHLAGFDDTGVNEPRPGGAAVPFARPFAVYPNPYCYATSTGGVNFVGLKAPARVEVYDLAGRRVAREEVAAGRDACVWRPAGVGGEALSPGVYLYRVEGQEQEESGKVVIAR